MYIYHLTRENSFSYERVGALLPNHATLRLRLRHDTYIAPQAATAAAVALYVTG